MPTKPPSPSDGNTIHEVLARLHEILLDGLRHGYFDCSMTSEVIRGKQRRLVIKAGKSYQFTISEDDLHQSRG